MDQITKILDRLLALHPKEIDLSLGRMHRLLTALGNPENKLPPVIHVAGTNGKGSVTATMRAILEASGKRCHVYTSPHLVSFNERIRLGTEGKFVSDPALYDALHRCEEANAGAEITFFEITTAAALRDASRARIRQRFNVVIERVVRELQGVSCLSLDEVAPTKQQIMASRSFSRTVSGRCELREAVLSYVARAAEKLRGQGSLAGAIQVFIRTNPFKPEVAQYANSTSLHLPLATDDTLTLGRFALAALDLLYREGFAYHKAGVMLMDLVPRSQRQGGLFDDSDAIDRRSRLNSTLDAVNRKFGRGTLAVAGAGTERGWQMRRQHLSPAYTTAVESLPEVR